MLLRQCNPEDLDQILEIINDSAQAYKGVIPEDRWHDPYMPRWELVSEIASGVRFWGIEKNSRLMAVMGLQDKRDVALIRHAYVRTRDRRAGAGALLLGHLEELSRKPMLIGTWAAAHWAVSFYQKHGYNPVSPSEKNRLLKSYWAIPERQIETSIVLADARWFRSDLSKERTGKSLSEAG